MNEYQVDTQIQLNGTFYNVGLNVLADPSTISLFIEDPSVNVTEYTLGVNPIVKTGVGTYFMLFVPPSPGEWTYQWQGTGNVIATSRPTRFFVRASALITA
jgi:hypothetical protein